MVLEFSIRGMHCASCSAHLERTLADMPQVKSATVNLATNTARVDLREGADAPVARQAVIDAVAQLGFPAEALPGKLRDA